MGMYTEIYVNIDLVEDLPDDVLHVLKGLVRDVTCSNNHHEEEFIDTDIDPWEDERFQKLTQRFGSRFPFLFSNGSYYTPYTPYTTVARLNYDFISRSWSLIGKGDIKDYDGEIDDFFEWIKEYSDTEFLGYSRYEKDREPLLHYKD